MKKKKIATVRMRCSKCGAEENVPETELHHLREIYALNAEEEDKKLCPYCLSDMFRADTHVFEEPAEENVTAG